MVVEPKRSSKRKSRRRRRGCEGAFRACKTADVVTARLEDVHRTQANLYLYAQTRIAKSLFDDPMFEEMMVAACEYGRAGGTSSGIRDKKLTLSSRDLDSFLLADFEIFKTYLAAYLREVAVYSGGNTFAQAMHDHVMLENRQKYLAFGLQVVDPSLEINWVICLGFDPVIGSATAEVTKDMLMEMFHSMTTLNFLDIVFDTISDKAAVKVPEFLGQLRCVCAMHQGDKVGGRACNGNLTRSRANKTINPFDKGQSLISKAQDTANHFSDSSDRRLVLKTVGSTVPGGIPNCVPQTCHCHTRVASRRNMLRSLLRLNCGLRKYMSFMPTAPQLTAQEWLEIRDIEAVMAIVGRYTTVVQTEAPFMRAIGIVEQHQLLASLRAETIDVIDMENVTEANTEPRKSVRVDELSDVGKTCLKQAILEAERRFCGNKAETIEGISGGGIHFALEDVQALLLDPRTFGFARKLFSKEQRADAKEALFNEYVKYGLKKAATSASVATDGDSGSDNGAINSRGNMALDSESDEELAHSDDDSEDGASDDDNTLLEAQLRQEAEKTWAFWAGKMHRLDWTKLWPQEVREKDLGKPHAPQFDVPNPHPRLLRLAPVGKILTDMRDHKKQCYGLWPYIATHSGKGIGMLTAARFCERINSVANHLVKSDNTRWKLDMIAKAALLRMNKKLFLFLKSRSAESSTKTETATAQADD